MRLLKQVLSFALNFFLIYAKMTLTQFLAELYFPYDCSVQGTNARKVNCGRVFSAYILKPVFSGRNL